MVLGDSVVVGTDGSASAELAVDRAGELGRALGACVHVVSAYSLRSAGERLAAAGGVAAAEFSGTEQAQAAEELLDKSRERLEALSTDVQTHASASPPAQALVRVAEEAGAQVIVVGNRGMTGPRRILGSVPNDVSHHARCGVLIVPTRSRSNPGGAALTGGAIVVGTDGSATARLAVQEAVRLAQTLGGELHITSSYKPMAGARIHGASPQEAQAWGLHPHSNVEAVLDEAAASARVAGVVAATHASRKHPADAILDVAQEANAAVIVVGSKGMHGTKRVTITNVPNQVSHKGACNVLIAYTNPPTAN